MQSKIPMRIPTSARTAGAAWSWLGLILTAWSGSAATLHVWQDSPSPGAPYGDWASAAHTIQEAVDAAEEGDTVLVRGGVYDTGGRAVVGLMTNRVTIDKAIRVESLMGPEVTVIEGAAAPGGGNGNGAIRCAYLGTKAVLSGFTLTNGHAAEGGGVYCELAGVVTNCVLTGNSANAGGGAYEGTLYNCTLTGNSAWNGGGAGECTLYNCTLTGNSADYGGGTSGGTLYNCIVRFNTGSQGSNHLGSAFSYSCTAPLPPGEGNIDDDPQLASTSHLAFSSPCIGAGSAAYTTGVDIDGEPWADPPCIGADQVRSPATGLITVRIEGAYTQVVAGFALDFVAHNQGPVLATVWDFGDGTLLTNQPHVRLAWTTPGRYPVSLTGYNDDFPGGVVATTMVELVEQPVYYVNAAHTAPAYPYSSWETAALSIQEAIGAGKAAGRLVLVANGVYDTGGVVVGGVSASNRVALINPVVVRSVHGPEVAIIRGPKLFDEYSGGMRCAYVGKDAILSGFTLTNGAAWSEGGGVWCESGGVVTNCILSGNWAYDRGGGAFRGTLYNCTLTGNSANGSGGGAFVSTLCSCTLIANNAGSGGGASRCTLHACTLTGNGARCWGECPGGGAYGSTLYNCTLMGNSAYDGGGANECTLYNCTLTGNSAWAGGGAYGSTLYNCVAYFNIGSYGPNYHASTFRFSCTSPLPPGEGDIDAEPLFLNAAAGDFRLAYGSPCIDTGTDLGAFVTNDVGGNPRPLDGNWDGIPAFDMGAYEYHPQTADSNTDGIPDWWCHHYLLDPTDAGLADANPDNDGQTTYQEWIADTDPTNALACFHIDRIEIGVNGSPVTIHFMSSLNRVYTLQCCADLSEGGWTDVPGQTARRGSGGLDSLNDTNAAPQKFYQVRVDVP